MVLASFEPGQEMAIANFLLAIFCIFTISLPLLLITRGGKTKANRDFIAATINPWTQIVKEEELIPVDISGLTPSNEIPFLAEISETKNEFNLDSDLEISIKEQISEEIEKSSKQLIATNEELLAA
tara:strand:- start:735 stop:1112 length:378 start_codon:yes stop_codon:yes gene_type:complete